MDFASNRLAFFRRSSNGAAVYLVREMVNQIRTTLEERNIWSKHAAYKNFICPCRVLMASSFRSSTAARGNRAEGAPL